MSLGRFQHVCHMAQTTNSSYCGNDRIPCTFCSFRGQTMKLFFFSQGKMLPAPYCYLGIFGALQVNLTWVMLLFKYSRSLAEEKKQKKNPQPNPQRVNVLNQRDISKNWKKLKLQILVLCLYVTSCHSVPLFLWPFSRKGRRQRRGTPRTNTLAEPQQCTSWGKGDFYCFWINKIKIPRQSKKMLFASRLWTRRSVVSFCSAANLYGGLKYWREPCMNTLPNQSNQLVWRTDVCMSHYKH